MTARLPGYIALPLILALSMLSWHVVYALVLAIEGLPLWVFMPSLLWTLLTGE